jgi:AcrR family transcriptional regulator
MIATGTRKTAAERREQILDAALAEFAQHGYEGASTDAIARTAGISQPYLFRLFGTKKGLYLASADRCFADTYETFRAASDGLSGDDALEAMGKAYKQMISEDPRRLQAQMQCYAACDDADVCRLQTTRRARGVEGRAGRASGAVLLLRDADQRDDGHGPLRPRPALGAAAC